VTYAFEWIPGPALLGVVLLVLVVPSFALIGLVVIALAAVAALAALAGAILAMPYLLVRSLRRRLAGRRIRRPLLSPAYGRSKHAVVGDGGRPHR
jgi:hypothetical protein